MSHAAHLVRCALLSALASCGGGGGEPEHPSDPAEAALEELARLQVAVSNAPGDPRLRIELARHLWHERGDLEGARVNYVRALEAARTEPTWHTELARLDLQRGAPEEAREGLMILLGSAPTYAPWRPAAEALLIEAVDAAAAQQGQH